MDVLDIRIFCDMGFEYHSPYSLADLRPNPSAIAKHLSLDARTVKARIKRMEQEGFIKYYQALPNYNALGFRCSAYAFPLTDLAAKKEAIRKLKMLEELTRIEEGLNSICVFPLYKTASDLEKKLALIKELIGQEPLKIYDVDMPAVGLKLSATDWLIIKSLRYDALKPLKKLAEELGLTLPTVRKRLERLIHGKVLFIVPIFSAERVTNLILYTLVFFVKETKREKTLREIQETFKERSYYRVVNLAGVVTLRLFATRMGEPEDNYMKAKGIDGVDNVFMDFVRETHDISECIDSLIDDRILTLKEKSG